MKRGLPNFPPAISIIPNNFTKKVWHTWNKRNWGLIEIMRYPRNQLLQTIAWHIKITHLKLRDIDKLFMLFLHFYFSLHSLFSLSHHVFPPKSFLSMLPCIKLTKKMMTLAIYARNNFRTFYNFCLYAMLFCWLEDPTSSCNSNL